eukprot:m.430051 g.430051  ORF g.430051 m.430051 type:complete len:259 (+) comp56726_c0_seq2:127-903(+)
MVNCTIACPTVQATPSSYSLWLQALSYLVLGMWCVLLLIRDYQRASISFRPQVLAAQLVLCFFRSLTTFIALPWADEFAMYLITYTVPIFFQFLVIFLLLLFLGRSYVALSSRYRKLAVDIGFGTLCVVCMVLCVLDATFSAQDSGGSFYDQRISYLGAFMFGFIGFLTAFVGTLVFWFVKHRPPRRHPALQSRFIGVCSVFCLLAQQEVADCHAFGSKRQDCRRRTAAVDVLRSVPGALRLGFIQHGWRQFVAGAFY